MASISCAIYIAFEITNAFQNGDFVPEIFRHVKQMQANIYFSFSLMNVLFLLFSFCGLRMKMKEIFGVSLTPEFNVVRNNFAILVSVDTIAMVFSIGYGYYYKIVCAAYIRWILTALIELTFNTSVIVSVLYLHYRVAQVETKEP